MTSLIEGSPPDVDDSEKSLWELYMNAGFCGMGRLIWLPSMKTTSNMDGRLWALSWTHKSPIWIHLRISLVGNDWSRLKSTISKAFPSLHKFHTCKWKQHHMIFRKNLVPLWFDKARVKRYVKEVNDYVYLVIAFHPYTFLFLTCAIRLRDVCAISRSVFLLPLIISSSNTPKLKTSDFIE